MSPSQQCGTSEHGAACRRNGGSAAFSPARALLGVLAGNRSLLETLEPVLRLEQSSRWIWSAVLSGAAVPWFSTVLLTLPLWNPDAHFYSLRDRGLRAPRLQACASPVSACSFEISGEAPVSSPEEPGQPSGAGAVCVPSASGAWAHRPLAGPWSLEPACSPS